MTVVRNSSIQTVKHPDCQAGTCAGLGRRIRCHFRLWHITSQLECILRPDKMQELPSAQRWTWSLPAANMHYNRGYACIAFATESRCRLAHVQYTHGVEQLSPTLYGKWGATKSCEHQVLQPAYKIQMDSNALATFVRATASTRKQIIVAV